MKACIFDMDGVLVDSAKYHFQSWKNVATELGIEFEEEDHEKLKGLSRIDSLERILTSSGIYLDNVSKKILLTKKNDWYLTYIKEMHPNDVFPGVKLFIESLRSEGFRIGLGSSSKNSRLILERTGLMALFDVVVDSNQVTFTKPNPEVFLLGAQWLGVSPRDTVVFEDSEVGVEAALAGGFRVIGVGNRSKLFRAEMVIDGFVGFSVGKMREGMGW